MQSHVTYTYRMLQKMHFEGIYKNVPGWAGGHHELLDGTGYPNHLTAKDIPKEVRFLTIIDVYDALTADDRPYKPPMPPEKAFGILDSMAEEGKIDKEILQMFKESNAWKREK
jgi:HD-GYP domain-containing protein (c-di-GMP phosphodiesterase class II)